MSFSDISASHLWNNIIQKLQGNSLPPENRNRLCSLKITCHALTKTSERYPLRMVWELKFIAHSVSNAYFRCYHCFSQGQLFERVANWSVVLMTMQLVQRWGNETYEWCKMAQGVPCAVLLQGRGNMVQFHTFIFAISQEYNYICLHFVIEYMYCHSLKIPAKYYNNRLDILTWYQFFLSYMSFCPDFPYILSIHSPLL